jgi:hypothetical protein
MWGNRDELTSTLRISQCKRGRLGVVGSLARKEICNLYHTILVEKFGLKDLNREVKSYGPGGERGHTFEDGR